jgi:hypothetical protein
VTHSKRTASTTARESRRGVKTTVELPADVWRAAKIRAMDDYSDLRSVIVEALRTHLRLSGVKSDEHR